MVAREIVVAKERSVRREFFREVVEEASGAIVSWSGRGGLRNSILPDFINQTPSAPAGERQSDSVSSRRGAVRPTDPPPGTVRLSPPRGAPFPRGTEPPCGRQPLRPEQRPLSAKK